MRFLAHPFIFSTLTVWIVCACVRVCVCGHVFAGGSGTQGLGCGGGRVPLVNSDGEEQPCGPSTHCPSGTRSHSGWKPISACVEGLTFPEPTGGVGLVTELSVAGSPSGGLLPPGESPWPQGATVAAEDVRGHVPCPQPVLGAGWRPTRVFLVPETTPAQPQGRLP